MKINNIELSYDDLVTLFSDGTFGSPLIISIVGSETEEYSKFRIKLKEKNPDACIEDVWAEWLLNGGTLELDANECDELSEDYDKDLVGTFDLSKVNEMITKAYNDDEVRWNVEDLINGNDDFYTGYNLLQYIAFGEVILG